MLWPKDLTLGGASAEGSQTGITKKTYEQSQMSYIMLKMHVGVLETEGGLTEMPLKILS
jgi:hypothetical protein